MFREEGGGRSPSAELSQIWRRSTNGSRDRVNNWASDTL